MYYRTLLLLSLVILSTACTKEVCPPENPPPGKDTTTINYELLLKDSLWAYYPFNNDIFDKSGNNRELSVRNGLWLSYDMWGNENSCLRFDGYDDLAIIEDGRNFPEGNFTVAMKFNCPTLQGRLFQKADYTTAKGASFGLGFAFPGGSFLHYAITQDNNVCDSYADISNLDLLRTPDLLSDAWYYVVIVHENGNQKMYLNGKLVASQQTVLPKFVNCTTATFNFGDWWENGPNQFTGKIDDIRIYTRGLKENEISYLSECSMTHEYN